MQRKYKTLPPLPPEVRERLQDELDQGYTQCLVDVSLLAPPPLALPPPPPYLMA
jgi:hypothetical protein